MGYDAFYCMKYAITQSQYVDFLNCLPRTQQENRVVADITGTSVTNVFVMCDNTVPTGGNVIRCDANIGTGNITLYCDRNNNSIPNESDDRMSRACNCLRVIDWMAYLDWAGLRPMSFLNPIGQQKVKSTISRQGISQLSVESIFPRNNGGRGLRKSF